MKNQRTLFVMLIMMLCMAIVPATFAQDEPTYGLSAEDYALYTSANEATSQVTSGAFDYSLAFTISGVPDSGDVVIDLSGSGVFDSANSAFAISVNGSLLTDGNSMPLEVELRLVNETMYINAPMFVPGWLEMTADEAADFGSAFSPVDPAALTDGDLVDVEGASEIVDTFASFQPEQYINITRVGNTFNTVVDTAGLVNSEEFKNAMIELIKASSESQVQELSAEEMAEFGEIMQAMFSESVIAFSQTLSADNLVENTNLNLTLNIDPSSFGETGAPMNVAIKFNVDTNSFNQPQVIEVPADAQTLDALFGSM